MTAAADLLETAAAAARQAARVHAAELQPLHDRQQLVAWGVALAMMLVVFELVRRRKLREEYSWVWVATALLLSFLAWRQELLVEASRWIGAASVVSTLFFAGFVFLLALVLQFSVRLSRLTHRQRTMGQRLALLEAELARLRGDGPVELPPRRPASAGRDEVA